MLHTYQLVPTQNLDVPNNVIFLFLLETTSSQARIEDISMGRSLGRLTEEICKRDLTDARISVAQELEELSAMLVCSFIQ